MAQVIVGEGIKVFQAITLKAALKMYDAHRIRVNRMYTPKNMLATAEKITGVAFKRGEYAKAVDELQKWIDKANAGI